MCTNNHRNQDSVISHGIHIIVCSLCQNKHLWAAGTMEWSEAYEQFLQISLQLLFNVVSGNREAKDRVWQSFFPECFKMVHQYFTHNFKLVSLAKAVLYYCVCSAKTEEASLDRLQSFLNDKDAVNFFFSNSFSEQDGKPSDWIQYFVSLLLSLDSKTPTPISLLYSSLQSKSFSIVSPTQLVLIHYILYIADDSPEMIDWVLQMTHASGTLMEENGHLVFNKDLLENRDETSKEGRSYEMFVEAFGLLLTILAGQIGGLSPGFCDTILKSELFWVLLAVLAIPEIVIDDSETPVGDLGEKKGTAMIKQKEDIWTAGTRDAVLQILGNMVNNSVAAQNKMREVGGIELVLNHTKMHPKHPLQREWALFTIRNLCYGNEENQRYINEFKAEGVAAEPALEKLGVKVEMDQGKVKVSTRTTKE
ncbi:uncharacterized protein [Blastocystis hominis]|uniref:Ataxin-10 domain-containing protein n=1 Tax=Blastocystis hominis TaxID=12968 RepID=D8M0H2_BLAHO|nr:uncharacterized protein [Blastocystis hominis]CBK21561.2 unnamed protein product [Blastocystis hominis]|eukprot:XP_012895609.1 uncharacterized protein [Blastocystis hominis]